MVRQRASISVLAAALLALPSCSEPRRTSPVDGVLLVVCDTLRADRLGCYGGDVPTPNIDGLAARGVRFADARSQGGHTLPSMISLMSGLWVTEPSDALPKDAPTLAEVFEDASFHTAAFVANPLCSRGRGFARGFEHFEEVDGTIEHSDALARRFRSWLELRESEDDAPWFAWVHAMDPHAPYTPRDEDLAAVARPLASNEQLAQWRTTLVRFDPAGAALSNEMFDHSVATMLATRHAYDAEVRAFDAALGDVLATLDALGETERTLIVFASDHGEMLHELALYPGDFADVAAGWREKLGLEALLALGHQDWFHREVWHTPLVIAGPGFDGGRVVNGLAANLDIAPTLVASAAVAALGPLDGQDLGGVEHVEREHVFAFSHEASAVRSHTGAQWVELPRSTTLLANDEPSGLLEDEARAGLVPTRDADRRATIDTLARALADWRAGSRFVPNFDVDASEEATLERLGYQSDDERGDVER
jgi:arylsulfatase A-like enzyme